MFPRNFLESLHIAALIYDREEIALKSWGLIMLTDYCIRIVVYVSDEFFKQPETANAAFHTSISTFGTRITSFFQPTMFILNKN